MEDIAYTEERRELLKDAARGSVRGGRELALGKCGEVVAEIGAQKKVAKTHLDASAQAGYEFPFVDGVECGNGGKGLRVRCGAGDFVIFRAGAG